MRNLAVILTFIAVTLTAPRSHSQTFQWAKHFGGGLGESRSVVTDDQGNVYTAGYFSGTVDFDTGPGTFNLTSTSGSLDIIVTKLDDNGDLVWARTMGGPGEDIAFAIALDNSGNVYTTGQFTGTTDFDPGLGTFTQTAIPGAADVFISKLDNNGNFVWARQFEGNAASYGYALTVDALGNIYTAGYLQYTADFDPGANAYLLSATGIGGDIFVSKLDASGNFVWAKRMGGSSDVVPSVDIAYSLAVDQFGNVYSTGVFEYTVDFDPGSNEFNLTSSGGHDIFISKLNANGQFVWAGRLGGPAYDFGSAIATDANGNIYVTGYFEGVADFDPGLSALNLSSAGGYDIFTVMLGTGGALNWAKQQGGTDNDHAFAISLDASQNVYTTGHFRGTADFDPGSAEYTLTSVGGSADLFISKLGPDGRLISARHAGGTGDMHGYSIDVNAAGSISVVGPFSGTADFDPGTTTYPTTYPITAIGSIDMFTLRLSGCEEASTCVITGIDPETRSNLRPHPNPTAGIITIQIPENLKGTALRLRNSLGQTLSERTIGDMRSVNLEIQGAAGLYVVELETNEGNIFMKVLKF